MVENGLEEAFSDAFRYYNNVYSDNFFIDAGGTSRTLIKLLSQDTAIIITRPLLDDEKKFLKIANLTIDTLGFGQISFDTLTICGDINYGYNFLLKEKFKLSWNNQTVVKPTYENPFSAGKNHFEFPIIFIFNSDNKYFNKFLSYFEYQLPNTILKKHFIKPNHTLDRTILLEDTE